jgi:hypothetical protein
MLFHFKYHFFRPYYSLILATSFRSFVSKIFHQTNSLTPEAVKIINPDNVRKRNGET